MASPVVQTSAAETRFVAPLGRYSFAAGPTQLENWPSRLSMFDRVAECARGNRFTNGEIVDIPAPIVKDAKNKFSRLACSTSNRAAAGPALHRFSTMTAASPHPMHATRVRSAWPWATSRIASIAESANSASRSAATPQLRGCRASSCRAGVASTTATALASGAVDNHSACSTPVRPKPTIPTRTISITSYTLPMAAQLQSRRSRRVELGSRSSPRDDQEKDNLGNQIQGIYCACIEG